MSEETGTLDVSNSAGSVTAEELQRAILETQQMRFSDALTANEWIAPLSQHYAPREMAVEVPDY